MKIDGKAAQINTQGENGSDESKDQDLGGSIQDLIAKEAYFSAGYEL